MRVQFTRRVANPKLRAQPGQVLDLPDDEALKRIEAGHCTPVDEPKAGLLDRLRGRKAKDDQAPGPVEDKPLEKMTVEELRAYADEQDISLPERGKKDELLAVITAALEEREDTGQ